MVLKNLRYNPYMVSMLILNPGIDQNVINEHNQKYVKLLSKHSVNLVHKLHQSIRNLNNITKNHDDHMGI